METASSEMSLAVKRFGMAKTSCREFAPRASVNVAGDHLFAAGEHDFEHTPQGLSILDRLEGDGNFVAGFEGELTEAARGYASRRLSLHNPVHQGTALGLGVEGQEAMGIGPRPFCDRPFDGNSFSRSEEHTSELQSPVHLVC